MGGYINQPKSKVLHSLQTAERAQKRVRYIPGIFVKHVLSSLSVMKIPVNDQHSLQSKPINGILSRNGCVVEYAVARCLSSHGMMTRRSKNRTWFW